jgi:hypothetical protein
VDNWGYEKIIGREDRAVEFPELIGAQSLRNKWTLSTERSFCDSHSLPEGFRERLQLGR